MPLSKQFFVDTSQAGKALDQDPGVWDIGFYGETLQHSAPFTLASDSALSQQSQVGPAFKGFVNNQG